MQRHPKIRKFYSSKTWTQTAKLYKKRCGGLCERCQKNGIYTAGEIVHHKIHVTPDNVENPNITTNMDNLELLCRKCHAEEHGELYGHDKRRYEVIDGKVIVKS